MKRKLRNLDTAGYMSTKLRPRATLEEREHIRRLCELAYGLGHGPVDEEYIDIVVEQMEELASYAKDDDLTKVIAAKEQRLAKDQATGQDTSGNDWQTEP